MAEPTTRDQAHCPNDDFPIRDEKAGCPRCRRPGAASQSVPAAPVSSTGGTETGEAAETATEALRALVGNRMRGVLDGDEIDDLVDALAGWRPPLPATGPLSREQLGEKVRAVATAWSLESADRPGAGLQTWEQLEPDLQEMYMRCGEALFGLGMTWSPVPSPLPDSETEPTEISREIQYGVRDQSGNTNGPHSYRDAVAIHFGNPTLEIVQREAEIRTVPGPWQVTA